MIDLITIITGFGLKLLGAIVAFGVARLALRNLDKAVGFDFKAWLKGASDEATAVYLSARIIAIAVLFGLVL